MALAKDKNLQVFTGGATRVGEGDVGTNAVIYKGAGLAKNAAGYIVPAADTAALRFIGFAEEAVNNTGGADGAKTVKYITGVIARMKNQAGAIVQAHKHGPCYAFDDEAVTTAAIATNDVLVGIVMAFTTTIVDVYVNDGSAALVGTDVGTLANAAVSPAAAPAGVPVMIAIDIPDAATTTYSYVTPEKIEIIDVWNIKDVAGAGNTIQVTDGADAAITNAMAAAVDKTSTRAGTIDKAKRVLAAGATYKVVATRAAGSMAAQLFILAIKRP